MKIRQEINILGNLLAAASGSSATSSEIVRLDTTKYNNPTYYFEIVTNSSVSLGFNVSLRRSGTSTDDSTIAVPVLTTANTLIRSTSFTPPAGQTNYVVFIDASVGATKNVHAARIIIIDNPTTLTSTQTQIDLGDNNSETTTSTTDVDLGRPKYWLYTSSNWDATITVFFEAVIATASTKSATTATLQVADGTGDGFTGWSNVASSAVTTTSTTAERVRSGAITLTAGRNYRTVFKSGTSKSAATLYGARIIIDQISGAQLVTSSSNARTISGGTNANSAAAQGFTISSTATVTGVKLRLAKNGSPTDTVQVDITSSLGGSSLATATMATSSLATTHATYTFTFGSPVSLTGGVKYYIEISRSPNVQDTTNNFFSDYTNTSRYPDGGYANRNNTTWGSESSSDDLYFEIQGQLGITKLEPQYLLSNTSVSSGTGLKGLMTKWDSTEWDGVTNVYKFAADSSNDATTDASLAQADGGGTVTGSSVTDIDNQDISSAMTMPSSENLDLNRDSAGVLNSTRILVATTVVTSTDLSVNVSDSITLSESVGMFTDQLHRSVSDTITITENADPELHSFVSKSDSVTITENTNVALGANVSVSDNVTVTENVKVELNSFVNKSDSVTITENTSVFIPELYRSVSDSITVTESTKTELTSFVNKSDNITITENADPELLSFVNVSDSVTITESLKLLDELNVNKSDSATISESVDVEIEGGGETDLAVSVSDSITVTESVKLLEESYINKSDSSTITESVSLLIPELLVGVSDSITLTESIGRLLVSHVTVTDNVTITEAHQESIGTTVNVSDSVTVTENTELLIPTLFIATSDSVAVTENVKPLLESHVRVSDSVTITENTSVSRQGDLSVSVSDSITVTEYRKVYIEGTPILRSPSVILLTDGKIAVKLGNNLYMPL